MIFVKATINSNYPP